MTSFMPFFPHCLVHIRVECVRIIRRVNILKKTGVRMNSKIRILNEKPYPLGCYIDYDNSLVVRAVFKESKKCGINLFSGKDSAYDPLKIELLPCTKKGDIYSARITGIENISGYTSYNFYCDDECFCDPYAKCVLGLENFGKNIKKNQIRARLLNKSRIKNTKDDFDWGDEKDSFIPYEESFVYLIHPRGFTKSPSSGVSQQVRGTFKGITEKIPYLKDLGVTTLELMPVYEMSEDTGKPGSFGNPAANTGEKTLYSKDGSLSDKNEVTSKVNFWGYKKGYYFAPRSAYCSDKNDPEYEFKSFVKALHDNDIEVILQFYFEEDESESLILDALRYWRCTYHVDGFHIKGARLPVRAIASEPLFSDIKIWHEWFDYSDLYGGKTKDIRNLADYNNGFLYSSRRFLKSDDNTVSDFVRSMLSNGVDHGVINYIADYEGFRLFDLVAYEHKHNEENGENNKDGTDNNLSWNCGIEGRTRKHEILSLRKKQIKNILTMLIFAQGTPMIFGGDEFGNSQGGNNNPYCQDNETGWVDWKALDKNRDIYEYVKLLLNMRKSHSILHEKLPYKLMDYASCGYPDLSCHGREAWRPDMSGHSHLIGMMYAGDYEKQNTKKQYIYVAYNMHWTEQEMTLPALPGGLKWELLSDTDDRGPVKNTDDKRIKPSAGKLKLSETEVLHERSVRIYVSSGEIKKKTKKKED